jgi:carboxyl-terminal processing protease
VADADGDLVDHLARAGAPSTLPLALLVDRDTASAAELFAGSLQAHGRAVVVGEATHGKGTGQAFVPDREGEARYLTVAGLFLPDGRAIEGAGVKPDHEVGGDVLAAAVERLREDVA